MLGQVLRRGGLDAPLWFLRMAAHPAVVEAVSVPLEKKGARVAPTAGEVRRVIEEYLDARIRPKSEEDRTQRETKILALLEGASDELLMQEGTKRRQQMSSLEQLNDKHLTQLIQISTETRKLRRIVDEIGRAHV